jgi:hypothetical protein
MGLKVPAGRHLAEAVARTRPGICGSEKILRPASQNSAELCSRRQQPAQPERGHYGKTTD